MRKRKSTMYKTAVILTVLCGLIISGCATAPVRTATYPALTPVPPPSAGQAPYIDNLLVISDISRSMRSQGKFVTEQALLKSFNSGIPNGLKVAGLRTFGKSAYDSTVLVQPLKPYDRAEFGSVIDSLKAGCGNTPLATALDKAKGDLQNSEGDIAILLVSDGENLTRDPIVPTLALKKKYGDRLCIYTVHVGTSEVGRQILNEIATQSGCGIATTAAELENETTLRRFISQIFFRGVRPQPQPQPLPQPKPVPPPPAPPAPLDSDGDGVTDNLDKCPNTPRGVQVDANGCPLDSDGDGVPDYLDRCPNTPKAAPVDEFGCWSIRGINFEYNKWDILPQYNSLLDQSVQVLKMNPDMKIEIQGHTDSRGSEGYNQQLSEKRAQSVKEYFVTNGVDESRITTRGFGETQPVATNDTDEGRAKNRRIEIKVTSE